MARRDDRRTRTAARDTRAGHRQREQEAPFSAAENQEAGRELVPRDATRAGAKNQLRPDTGRNGSRRR